MDIRHVTSIHGGIHFDGIQHLHNYIMSSTDISINDTFNSTISIYDIYRLFDLTIPEEPTTPKEYRKHLFSMFTNLYKKLNSDSILPMNNLVKNIQIDPEVESKIDNYIDNYNKKMSILVYRFTFDYLQRNTNLEGKKISVIIEDIISRTKPFINKGYDALKENFKEAITFFDKNRFIRLNKAKTHFAINIPLNIVKKEIDDKIIIDIWTKYKKDLINVLTFEEAINFLQNIEEKLSLSISQQLILHYFNCDLL